MLWDVFCRVVDNFGDIGVCWRAAADLAGRGERVRLWVDDPAALAWMAPGGRPGVQVLHWTGEAVGVAPGEVVIEAFGCNPPDEFVLRMAAMARPPVWINLEYLSAEPYVERSHGLPSPRDGLTKWFFYPGFTPRTGGLLREPGLIERLDALDGPAWLAARGWAARDGERVVHLFCYANPRLARLLDALSAAPTLILAAPGAPTEQLRAILGPTLRRGPLRAVALPHLPQPDYDLLLRACDLNFVRGEDSFVRAQWAARPFVWQIYPQDDAAHAAKLAAFLDRFLAGAPGPLAATLRGAWAAWNGLSDAPPALPPASPWQAQVERWREGLLVQPDLMTQIMGFVAERR
jgi:uncharacterized repeat protein (TIGR03837 family)